MSDSVVNLEEIGFVPSDDGIPNVKTVVFRIYDLCDRGGICEASITIEPPISDFPKAIDEARSELIRRLNHLIHQVELDRMRREQSDQSL